MDDLKERLSACKHVFYAFSGGRDSQRALELTLHRMARKHDVEILYVDNHTERTGTREHCERTCRLLGFPLTVIEAPTFRQVYDKIGIWPDSIHRDCIEKLINKQLDQYVAKKIGKQDYVLIRGGQPAQSVYRGTAKSKLYQLMAGKPNMIIYNPLWNHGDFVAKLPFWQGYRKGYTRTQCYCCPFATCADWQCMKRYDPDQWEETRRMFSEYAFPYHPGDGYARRIVEYWQNEHGVNVQFARGGKKFDLQFERFIVDKPKEKE